MRLFTATYRQQTYRPNTDLIDHHIYVHSDPFAISLSVAAAASKALLPRCVNVTSRDNRVLTKFLPFKFQPTTKILIHRRNREDQQLLLTRMKNTHNDKMHNQ